MSLIDAGLKVHGEGDCFNQPTQRRFGRDTLTKRQKQQMTAPTSTFPMLKMKFYLSFENAFHCNDYIRLRIEIFEYLKN